MCFEFSSLSHPIIDDILTLKQTQSENGSVTTTNAHEMAVRSHPQRPIPLSDSSAEVKRERE